MRDNKLSSSRDEQLKEIGIETDKNSWGGPLQIRNRDGIPSGLSFRGRSTATGPVL